MFSRLSLLASLGLSGCADPKVRPGPCDTANAELGVTVCVHDIPDRATWTTISGPTEGNKNGVQRLASFMTPASEDAPLPTLFVNQNLYPLHYDLLTQVFTDLYAGLSWEQYGDMVTDGANRTYYAGDISERTSSDGAAWFGFFLWEQPNRPSTSPTLAQVTEAWRALSDHFGVGPLVYTPYTATQVQNAASWKNPPFTIRYPDDDVSYEVYTAATGYGTVRRYTYDALEDATEAGEYGYQDVLILDQAPLDLERVVAGVVTGTRQGALSHINVRAAARGTPNCFVEDAYAELAGWEGLLVQLECDEDGYTVRAATQDEAEAWWATIRPDPVTVPTPDLDWDVLVGLLDLPTDTAAERALNVTRYGAKGSNLATLYQRIPADYQLPGFLLPFSYYDTWVRSQTWSVDVGGGPETLSFQATLDAWLADPDFRSDAQIRREKLEALREAMEASPVQAETVAAVVAMAREIHGDDSQMLRLRSSSNAEDSLEFSGAGLYTSESGCVADEVDDDDDGPSTCDPDKDEERTITAALTTVWASLWTMQAFEERDWYGIDHRLVSMGVLVYTRSDDEQANAVAFTGNPTALDNRYLVEAQIGEYDVVSAPAGVYPETTLVSLSNGRVEEILRVSGSSELESGQWVLSDGEVTELSELLWEIDAVFPIDEIVPAGHSLLLDTEWKLDDSGQLIIKQVRPFLRDDDAFAPG